MTIEGAALNYFNPKGDLDLYRSALISGQNCKKKSLFVAHRTFSKGRFGLRKKKHPYSL